MSRDLMRYLERNIIPTTFEGHENFYCTYYLFRRLKNYLKARNNIKQK